MPSSREMLNTAGARGRQHKLCGLWDQTVPDAAGYKGSATCNLCQGLGRELPEQSMTVANCLRLCASTVRCVAIRIYRFVFHILAW